MKILQQLTRKKRITMLMTSCLVGSAAFLTGCGSSNDSSSDDSSTGLYVSNELGDNLTYCQVSENSLSNCSNQTPDSGSFDEPAGIGEYDNGSGTTYLYIANNGNDTLTRCDKGSSGSLINCSAQTVSSVTLAAPADVVVHEVNGQPYLYIPNADNTENSIVQCSLETDGDLTGCNTTTGFNLPDEIAFQTADSSDTYAYITNAGSDEVQRCDVNTNDGTLSSCIAEVSTSLDEPLGIAFNTSSGTTYAYIANGEANGAGAFYITQCEFNSSGNLVNCESLTDTTLDLPADIAFNDDKAYIVNADDNTVSVCSLDSNGGFDECDTDNGGGNFNAPDRITFLAD